ncbi:hypothetical protein [Hymenobacter pini]|uniref:hypothetical protein n=1 Tax=Hymenobacter pini TaxID=2880879 RepID=UPI001CF10D37|nr:hypothetical protein [Hymenobacter pini]MCA8831153.1 hypothetical protein [Hymenobacter pini]
MDTRLEEITAVFNKAFDKIGQAPLIGNTEFVVDNQSVSSYFMRVYSVPKPNRVEVSFELTSSGATFWIDKTREMPDVSYDMIKENAGRFEELIEMIFTSVIHAEYKGQRTILSFIHSIDSIMIGQFKFQSGLLPSCFSSKTAKIYEPYFEV